MHIAICDDNIADRKQTERLLGKESDRRAKTESVLYIDIQSLPPAGYCEKCGGEVYRPSLRCYRCEEEEE